MFNTIIQQYFHLFELFSIVFFRLLILQLLLEICELPMYFCYQVDESPLLYMFSPYVSLNIVRLEFQLAMEFKCLVT
jgi:hypothetical protein